MTKLHGKSVLLGMGMGIIFTALLGLVFFLGYKPEMDEGKVKALAKKYGMVEMDELSHLSFSSPVTIEIEREDTLTEITKKLVEAGVVKEPLSFQIKMANQNAKEKLMAGCYEFTGNETEQEIIERITGNE